MGLGAHNHHRKRIFIERHAAQLPEDAVTLAMIGSINNDSRVLLRAEVLDGAGCVSAMVYGQVSLEQRFSQQPDSTAVG
jgi:hypothetical protein